MGHIEILTIWTTLEFDIVSLFDKFRPLRNTTNGLRTSMLIPSFIK